MFDMYNMYKNKTSVQGHIDGSFLDSLFIGFLSLSEGTSEGTFYSTITTSESSPEEISITSGGLL